MLFTVTVYVGGLHYWTTFVEAEDREGAIREAMHVVERKGGFYSSTSGKAAKQGGPITVDVDAVDRDEAEEITDTLLREALKSKPRT